MDRGAQWATAHSITKSQTRWSTHARRDGRTGTQLRLGTKWTQSQVRSARSLSVSQPWSCPVSAVPCSLTTDCLPLLSVLEAAQGHQAHQVLTQLDVPKERLTRFPLPLVQTKETGSLGPG